MLDRLAASDSLGVCASVLGAVGLCALGLVIGKALRGGTRPWLLPAALAALTGFAALLILTQSPLGLWLPLLLLAVLAAGFWVARAQHVWEAAFAFVSRGRLPWYALLVLSPLVAVWWGVQAERQRVALKEVEAYCQATQDPHSLVPVAQPKAVTDRGRPVGLYALPDEGDAPALSAAEESLIQKFHLDHSVIRQAEPSAVCNCHGWAFACGRYWVKDDDVDHILLDNGYSPVPAPAVDDVAIYRNAAGLPIHSGVVRAAGGDGLVLVESKWGRLGRFIHPATKLCYVATCTFYHSSRHGNRLAGLADQSCCDVTH